MRRTTTSRLGAATLAAALTAVAAGCGGDDPSAEAASDIPGITPELIEAAQEEGGVVLYGGGHSREHSELLKQRMQELFGVEVTYTRSDSGTTVNSVNAELDAGELNVDVVSAADPFAFAEWSSRGAVRAIEVSTQDQIPEVMDTTDTPEVAVIQSPMGIVYNSANTDEGDVPQAWSDLAASDLKVVSGDPSSSGSAAAFYTLLASEFGDDLFGWVGANDPFVTDSSLAITQLVLTGEADIGVPGLESAVLASAAGGEPVVMAYPDGPIPTIVTFGVVMSDAPHPNAAELLLRYNLSEEFQRELSTIGSRGVLEGMPTPEGAAEVDESRYVAVTPEQLESDIEGVRARFADDVAG